MLALLLTAPLPEHHLKKAGLLAAKTRRVMAAAETIKIRPFIEVNVTSKVCHLRATGPLPHMLTVQE